MSNLHPFDFDKLSKGTWIETDELEAATGCRRDHKDFNLKVLSLKALVEQETKIVSRIEGDRLRLMTDSEALFWSIKQFGKSSKGCERNASRLANNISPAALSGTERVVHEHAHRVMSSVVAAARAEIKKDAKLFALVYGPYVLEEPDEEGTE